MPTPSIDSPPDTARIVCDPAILVGKPVIRGTRISLAVDLDYLAHNPDLAELFADYPRLTVDDVKACLGHAQALVQEVGVGCEPAAASSR